MGIKWICVSSGYYGEVNMSKHKNPQYNFRMPEELKRFLEEQAQKDGRSLNNFLVKSLEELRMTLIKQVN